MDLLHLIHEASDIVNSTSKRIGIKIDSDIPCSLGMTCTDRECIYRHPCKRLINDGICMKSYCNDIHMLSTYSGNKISKNTYTDIVLCMPDPMELVLPCGRSVILSPYI